MAKRGPYLEHGLKRETPISFRPDAADRALFNQAAEAMGLNLSEWMRQTLRDAARAQGKHRSLLLAEALQRPARP